MIRPTAVGGILDYSGKAEPSYLLRLIAQPNF